MAVSEQFSAFVLDQLRAVRPVTARRMFGGVGYYAGTLFFALAIEDTLYFKVDDASRGDYEREGMRPFRPYGERGRPMRYYTVPARVLEDTEELGHWLQRALVAARATPVSR